MLVLAPGATVYESPVKWPRLVESAFAQPNPVAHAVGSFRSRFDTRDLSRYEKPAMFQRASGIALVGFVLSDSTKASCRHPSVRRQLAIRLFSAAAIGALLITACSLPRRTYPRSCAPATVHRHVVRDAAVCFVLQPWGRRVLSGMTLQTSFQQHFRDCFAVLTRSVCGRMDLICGCR
jgi:hypothetical protein